MANPCDISIPLRISFPAAFFSNLKYLNRPQPDQEWYAQKLEKCVPGRLRFEPAMISLPNIPPIFTHANHFQPTVILAFGAS